MATPQAIATILDLLGGAAQITPLPFSGYWYSTELEVTLRIDPLTAEARGCRAALVVIAVGAGARYDVTAARIDRGGAITRLSAIERVDADALAAAVECITGLSLAPAAPAVVSP